MVVTILIIKLPTTIIKVVTEVEKKNNNTANDDNFDGVVIKRNDSDKSVVNHDNHSNTD